MIERAKRTFINYPSKTVLNEWKVALKRLQVFIVINEKLKTTGGTAGFIEYTKGKRLFKIPDQFKPCIVDNACGFLIIEINPKLIILYTPKEVCNILSHELAHCLDFVLRGWDNGREEKSFHDEFWSFLHKRMGGDGEEFIKPTNELSLLLAKNKSKLIKQRFKNLTK
jgi:hypothetical protein